MKKKIYKLHEVKRNCIHETAGLSESSQTELPAPSTPPPIVPPSDNTDQHMSHSDGESDFRPSPDYRSVYWNGSVYSFTPDQAIIVRELHKARLNGTPEVGWLYLLEQADRKGSRVSYVFKSAPGVLAWIFHKPSCCTYESESSP